MHLDEIEERTYGGARNEFQNAFALSMMERKVDDPRIVYHLGKGQFVVALMVEQYCPFTDAALPSYQIFISAWPTKEEATQHLTNEEEYVLSPLGTIVVPEIPEMKFDDIPF